MNNQCTIANKRGAVVANCISPLSINFIKENCPTIAILKKRCEERGFVANNGRCTLVTPIDKNTSGQPQPLKVLQLNPTEEKNGRSRF